MISLFQAIILGLTQGVTELFPVSSLGHSVLIPGLLGWNINQNSETFLEFLVATHLATAIVLFAIYFKDWVRIIKGLVRSFVAREISDADPDAKLGWLLVVSTIPAGIIGLLLKDQITGSFLSPRSAAIFLALNGLLLLLAEYLRKRVRAAATEHEPAESVRNNDARIDPGASYVRQRRFDRRLRNGCRGGSHCRVVLGKVPYALFQNKDACPLCDLLSGTWDDKHDRPPLTLTAAASRLRGFLCAREPRIYEQCKTYHERGNAVLHMYRRERRIMARQECR